MSKIHKALQKAEREGLGFAPSSLGGFGDPEVVRGEATVLPRTIDDSKFRRATFTPAARKFINVPHAVSEDFHSLFTRLELQPATARTRSLLVTSAMADEGSSVVAMALGASIARKARNSVILVDGDFRNPNLDTFFALNGAPGLVEVLGGKAPVEEAIHTTEQERLYFLAAGKRNGSNERMDIVEDVKRLRTFGAFLKQHFNYVLIDASPVLSNSDVQVLAGAVDGAILVVKAHKTRRQVAQEARKLLERSGAKVIGVVLNRRRFPIPGWLYRSI